MKRRTFTAARPRTELIASHAYGPVPPPPDAAKPDAAPDPDQAVADALDTAKAAIAKALAAQKADPDSASDPADTKVLDGLNSLDEQINAVIKDQAADGADDDTEPAPAKPAVTAAAAAPEMPKANPVAENGDIDGDAECANADCGHPASVHLDQSDAGKNTGACQQPDCDCLAMQIEAQPNDGNGDDNATTVGVGTGSPSSNDEQLAIAVPDAPVAPGPAPAAGEGAELNKPPAMEGGDSMGPAFTIPVGIIEGQPTGDGRKIAPGALTWRTPPLPLMGLATETHDPEGWDLNDPAVMCGRIDSLERVPGEGDTQIVMAKGFYLPNEDGMYFAGLNEAMGRLGVSADVAVQASELEVGDVDPMGFPLEMSETLTEGTIMGFTVCPYPAFEGAYVVIGDGDAEAQAIPQQAEGPTVPSKPPAAVTAGGQLVHLMTYEQCEPCDSAVDVITAAGGPTRPPKAWFANPNFTEGDGRLMEILDRRGERALGGKFACPITVTDDGRVFGHIAPWGVCHTGTTGQCILAPKSKVDYAHFKRGQHVVSAEGEQIRVGVITADAGHASTRGVSAASAMAHYDNTALAVADVNVGDDEYGIWVAGAIRPEATEEQVRKLRAASISGDWRQLGGALELVAALAVNQPGFPLAVVADGHQSALVAAGATVMDRLKHPAAAPAQGDSTLRAALAPMLGEARARARGRLAQAATSTARERLEALR